MEKKIKKKEIDPEVELINDLMKIMDEKNLTELAYESKEFSVCLKGTYQSGREISKAPLKKIISLSKERPEQVEDFSLKDILSENIGLFFYQSGKEATQIAVGKKIETGDYIGYVMTLGVKNTVTSNVSGIIVEICVENGNPVDYGKTLVRIKEQ
jgi:biotin carboxyl carrier protein